MAGHMGAENVTVQNLVVVKVDVENNLIAVRGAVPGPKGGVVTIVNVVKAYGRRTIFMPKIIVVDMAGKVVSELELNENVFGIEPNKTAMHSVVVNYLANQRQGTQSTLTRTEVSGGGRKPWRQKGTGHARQGSTRSPQWRHGGIALGPKPRSYRFTLNKKVR